MELFLFVLLLFVNFSSIFVKCDEEFTSFKDPHFLSGRDSIVHLFEWKFNNIAYECENFLAPYGYAGVQISPVNENIVIPNRPWYERYQPLSYKIISRSGNEDQFVDMVRRCNNAGIRIYVDVVINHMTGNWDVPVGTGGSRADPNTKTYPDAGYSPRDFHDTCSINNYNDAAQVRNCELVGLHDLNQNKANVRCKIVDFLNKLIDHGVAGLRVDAAKHMWPADLEYIYGQLNNLSTTFFPSGLRPFVYQEVIDLGGEAVSWREYTSFARVTDFIGGSKLGAVFRKKTSLSSLKNWGDEWGILPDGDGVVFIDNHDNQRGHGAGGGDILTYKVPKQYKMAIAFLLARPRGVARVMSSFEFDNPSQGPPQNNDESIKEVEYNWDKTCKNGWMCEHRWRQIYSMNQFRSIVSGTNVSNWWDNGNNQIAFSRGNKGFIAFNGDDNDLSVPLQTGMPAGYYCDIISGENKDGSCTGKLIIVGNNGFGYIYIKTNDFDGFVAIHTESRLWNPTRTFLRKANEMYNLNLQLN